MAAESGDRTQGGGQFAGEPGVQESDEVGTHESGGVQCGANGRAEVESGPATKDAATKHTAEHRAQSGFESRAAGEQAPEIEGSGDACVDDGSEAGAQCRAEVSGECTSGTECRTQHAGECGFEIAAAGQDGTEIDSAGSEDGLQCTRQSGARAAPDTECRGEGAAEQRVEVGTGGEQNVAGSGHGGCQRRGERGADRRGGDATGGQRCGQ